MNSINDSSEYQPPVRYLSASELYAINHKVMDGDTLVRDLHLLNSAARRPMLSFFGQPQFPTVLDKAAALLHSMAYHHIFMDGNKRTALQAVTLFLDMNGYEATWDQPTEYAFILDVAQGIHDIPHIADWLARHTRMSRRD